MKINHISFFFALLLTGFYGGFGLFHLMGLLPAMQDLSDSQLVAFWQAIDRYMGARMPVLGPMLLVSVLFALVVQRKQWGTKAFWLTATSLLCILTDLGIAFNIDRPINDLVQSWDAANPPRELSQYAQKTFAAFRVRSVLMLLCSATMQLAFFLRPVTQIALPRKVNA